MSKFKAKDFEQRTTTPCVHQGCPDPAITKKKLSTGWADLCKRHGLFHAQQEANEFCRSNGLTTREKQIEFIRSKLGSGVLRYVIRQPGQEG